MTLKILLTMKNIPNKRRGKEEGHMAALIRRKMITKTKSSKKEYTRDNKTWKNENSFLHS